MSEKCWVCKNEISISDEKCPVCGFNELHKAFINKEDAENWMKTVVEPWRKQWKRTLIKKYTFTSVPTNARRLYGLKTLIINEDGSREIGNLDYGNADVTDVYNAWLLNDDLVKRTKNGYKIEGDFKREKLAFFGKDGKLVGDIWEGEKDGIPMSVVYEDMKIDKDINEDVLNKYCWMVHTHLTKNGQVFDFSQSDINVLLHSPLLGHIKYFSILNIDGKFRNLDLTKIDKIIEMEGVENFGALPNVEKRKKWIELSLKEMIDEEQVDASGDGNILRSV